MNRFPQPLDFRRVGFPEPHLQRTRDILRAHPEVRRLFGINRWTSLFVLGLVAAQVVLAFALKDSSWWLVLGTAYLVGAVLNHGLWALIHDCTHNLVFRSPAANSWLQIIANMPHIFPSAMSFRKYHLIHHKYQGDLDLDADLAAPFEARFAGRSWWRKSLWLLFYFAFQSARIFRLKKIAVFDRWMLANIVTEVIFIFLICWFLGPKAFVYLLLSSIFAIGLHPVGARWIQEHFMVKADQETYSYYGLMNLTAFNVGYHNEHHDFVSVPWSRLPRIRAIAPEYYNSLHYHRSWTRLLLQFIFDPNLTLYSRTVRVTSEKLSEKSNSQRKNPENLTHNGPEPALNEPVTI